MVDAVFRLRFNSLMFLLWRRAEADARRATELLGQVIELNTDDWKGLRKVVRPEQYIDLLRLARRNLLERRIAAADRIEQQHLGLLDGRLWYVAHAYRQDPVRKLLDRSRSLRLR